MASNLARAANLMAILSIWCAFTFSALVTLKIFDMVELPPVLRDNLLMAGLGVAWLSVFSFLFRLCFADEANKHWPAFAGSLVVLMIIAVLAVIGLYVVVEKAVGLGGSGIEETAQKLL